MNFLQKIKLVCLLAAVVFFNSSCGGSDTSNEPGETLEEGTIHVSADESFQPVIDSQIKVFESSYPNAKIIVHYKPEAECLKDFAVDSIRMVIATRGYTEAEENFFSDSLKLMPRKMTIAYDAISVIVNPASSDSMFTMAEIKDLLKGNLKKSLVPVFDGVKATSTVRFVIDSVLRGDQLGSNVVAARSSEGVIDYVSKNKDAVGFIGVSWIGNPQDSLQRSFLEKVKVAHIESTDNPGGYVQPYQANIYARRYPMVRDLVYTLKERNVGLGKGFANFLSGQRGQLIFRRAFLVPAKLSFNVRPATLRE
ncbi:substrate-binding domain-containing protein [Chitinophagaceae bacterium LB-8]|uniref:Substrate-binding domain-containing protein n=1 Tax=Paraflavisolibacter caeni TaxID=2982496 RepID=A0A9X2XS64_9BACT|nr:substrate-binding domain-containing protein [Paraflavisolibacter caeni]MCU7547856.1 substrate-binding domain-containing protein [Paraflavisolibacter caeni]